jgi:eukaryotic-like serine/threonine-protein kinase
MAAEHPLDDLADAILDGTPIDWPAAESEADENARPLLDPLKLLATLANVHRHPPLPHSRLTVSGVGEQSEAGDDGVADLSGEMIGVYRLIEPLGRGGMGEVYVAERADGRFDLKVALKLVKQGRDTAEILRRFVRERRILARLEHRGVARLFDAGETIDGRPYFVMELVEGEPITSYCRNRRLSIDDRLRLLASCCDAVDAAHRALVVHRDLKPSNVLVTSDGQVKLLDFGIATLLAEEQEDGDHGQLTRVLTPGYAAPEQILGGGVTVATDVFALGVVSYELLTGALPYDRRATSSSDLSARVEREHTELPSAVAYRAAHAAGVDQQPDRWARSLRGDLDAIIMKALAHEPARRYPSAAAFAADLRCYLTSRPADAHPDSRGYRLRKFVSRHRHGVAAAIVVVAALVAALAVSLVQISTARREADRAAAAQAFLISLFAQIDPDQYVGSAPTVRDLLERGSERLDLELAQQPELQAEMQAVLGQVFDQLLLPDRGEAHWRRALETRRTLFGPGDGRTLKTAKGLAISLARQGRYGESELLFQQLLEHERVLADARETGSVLLNYGNVKRFTGNYEAAQALFERAVPLLESAGEPARQSLATALSSLGLLYRHPAACEGCRRRAGASARDPDAAPRVSIECRGELKEDAFERVP